MAQGQGRNSSSRVIQLTPQAEDDRLLTYLYTEQQWGTRQADNYDEFLQSVMQQLSEHPTTVPTVPEFSGLRRYTARYRNARQGHTIFFEETSQGINVIRILHTSMNWQAHLSDE